MTKPEHKGRNLKIDVLKEKLSEVNELLKDAQSGNVRVKRKPLSKFKTCLEGLLVRASDQAIHIYASAQEYNEYLHLYGKYLDVVMAIPSDSESSSDEEEDLDSVPHLTEEQLKKKISDGKPCQDQDCILFDTPPVGIFELEPKSMEESLLGKINSGEANFKLGKGKVKKGSVDAAHNLVEREFPQVISPNQFFM